MSDQINPHHLTPLEAIEYALEMTFSQREDPIEEKEFTVIFQEKLFELGFEITERKE